MCTVAKRSNGEQVHHWVKGLAYSFRMADYQSIEPTLKICDTQIHFCGLVSRDAVQVNTLHFDIDGFGFWCEKMQYSETM